MPCRVLPVRRVDDIDAFLVPLREYNRQRDKTNAEKLREELIGIDPSGAYSSLIEHRQKLAEITAAPITLKDRKSRAAISDAKRPMLEAVKRVLNEMRAYWPVSERKVHYKLLNDPPLRHAGKPDSHYGNTSAV